MINATVELFMTEYFLIKAVLGKFLDNGENLFRALSKVFLISEKEVKALYALAENEIAREITTEGEFMQHQRLLKYSRLVGSHEQVNSEWEEVVSIKGNAILLAQSHGLISDADVSRNALYERLSAAITVGKICALRVVGILQCEGIFFDKNPKAGIKKLLKAADWNDGLSTLALLSYSEKNREFNMARLRLEVEDAPFASLYQTAVEYYGVKGDTADVSLVKLLEKVFASGGLKRDTYDSNFARILLSKAISLKEKEKAVFSPNKELQSLIGDLPLKLSHENVVAVDVSCLDETALRREAERTEISRALSNADLRGLVGYRPLCLCCDSKYILTMYAQALMAKSANAHVEIIDVAELPDYDFEPTKDNIFLRGIDEDKDNRLFLFCYGTISERKMDALKRLLQTSRRAKFHLNNIGVTLDLSAVLPICFCDKQNEHMLKPYCDLIQLAPVSQEETSCAIQDVLAAKQKLYGVGTIRLECDIMSIIGRNDIDLAEKLIDVAVRAQRVKGADITLTKAILERLMDDNNRPRIGFGGEIYGKH